MLYHPHCFFTTAIRPPVLRLASEHLINFIPVFIVKYRPHKPANASYQEDRNQYLGDLSWQHIYVYVLCTDSFHWCHMRLFHCTIFCGRSVPRWWAFIRDSASSVVLPPLGFYPGADVFVGLQNNCSFANGLSLSHTDTHTKNYLGFRWQHWYSNRIRICKCIRRVDA